MSDETNGDGMKHERPEVVDDMAVGVSFFIPEEDQQAVAPARPIMSASGDEIARNVRWFLQRAVDELEHQEADTGAMLACEHVPSVVESALPWIMACVDHPDAAGVMCSDCLELHVVEHAVPWHCSVCGEADGSVDPAATEPQPVKHQPCRVGASDERFGIRRAEMVLVLFLCDSCRVRGFEQAAEIADLERRLHDPETAR